MSDEAAVGTVLDSPAGGRRRARRWRPLGRLGAYAYRVPACVPFWSGATYRAMLGRVATGTVVDGPHVGRLEQRLAGYLGVPGVVACSSGRAAIELALRALGIGARAEVLVPSFCCESIVRPILAVGAVPVLADVGPELNLTVADVERALTAGTRAVIVPHLFGNPADIAAIASLCGARGIAVIDDAAQALGAHVADRAVGSFGDAGVVSFGNGKVCFGTGGGVLVSGRLDLAERARRMRATPGRAGQALLHALAIVVWRRWRRWSLPVWAILRRLGRVGEASASGPAAAMRNLDAAVALSLLERLPDNVAARRQRVAAYHRLLASCEQVRLVPHQPGSACLTQVVEVDARARTSARELMAELRAEGFEIGRSFVPLHRSPRARNWTIGRLPYTEAVWNRLIELPCEPSVALDDVERIAASIRKAVA